MGKKNVRCCGGRENMGSKWELEPLWVKVESFFAEEIKFAQVAVEAASAGSGLHALPRV